VTLLPREHGAYGQMIFPPVTALLICGISVSALACMAAVAAAFVAHEPALILIGRRGARLAWLTGRGRARPRRCGDSGFRAAGAIGSRPGGSLVVRRPCDPHPSGDRCHCPRRREELGRRDGGRGDVLTHGAPRRAERRCGAAHGLGHRHRLWRCLLCRNSCGPHGSTGSSRGRQSTCGPRVASRGTSGQ
jgi:YwiC-like protein